MKLWIDDTREAPEGFIWAKSVNSAIQITKEQGRLDLIDIDHDAGDYFSQGGDYIKYLDWLEEMSPFGSIRIHIHSGNPVGIQKMRQVIRKNGWVEVFNEWE